MQFNHDNSKLAHRFFFAPLLVDKRANLRGNKDVCGQLICTSSLKTIKISCFPRVWFPTKENLIDKTMSPRKRKDESKCVILIDSIHLRKFGAVLTEYSNGSFCHDPGLPYISSRLGCTVTLQCCCIDHRVRP